MRTKGALKRRSLRAVIPVSVPADDAALIDRARAKVGETASGFMRDAATDRARTILGIPAEPPLQAAS